MGEPGSLLARGFLGLVPLDISKPHCGRLHNDLWNSAASYQES